jgi:hypothetical protein
MWLVLLLGALALLALLWLSADAPASADPDEPPTPVIRTVTRALATVVPVTDVVAPEQSRAAIGVGPAQASEVDTGDSAGPFGWSRGLWIGIGTGVVAAGLLAAAVGWRLRAMER